MRAAAADAKAPTELILSQSSRSGEQVRFCTNRKLLTRAMRLGFDRLHVFSPESPVLCVDGSRKFVWMLLDIGWLDPNEPQTFVWEVLIVLATIMAIGMSWSIIRRKISGQIDQV